MDPSSSDRNPVDELAEEFVQRYRRGVQGAGSVSDGARRAASFAELP